MQATESAAVGLLSWFLEGVTLLKSLVEMVVIAARSSDLGKVDESNGRENKIMRLRVIGMRKFKNKEKMKNNCERRDREINLEWT